MSSGKGGSERRSEQSAHCLVCLTPKSNSHWGMCHPCQRSFDRSTAKEHTIMAVIVWAARRARRAARAEKKGAST